MKWQRCCITTFCGWTLRGRNTLDSRRNNTGKQPCVSPKETGKFGTILQRRPEVARKYNEVLSSQRKDTSEKGTPEESMVRPKWFLPHFPVICEDKATTKFKSVFDSAAKFKGHSLNDMMHAGPKLQNDLVGILICFRPESVALVGDICEMFLQLGLAEKDRPYHCILWCSFETFRPVDVYEFLRFIFGDKASP